MWNGCFRVREENWGKYKKDKLLFIKKVKKILKFEILRNSRISIFLKKYGGK